MLSSIARLALLAMLALPAALCFPGRGSDGVVATKEIQELVELLGQHAGRELAETSDANMTTSMLAGATTSMLAGAVKVVKGSLTMTVNDPAEFVKDPNVKTAIGKSIGEIIGVPATYISVTLTVVERRLEGSLRRLTGSVKVDYTITLPATAPAGESVNTDASDIVNKMKTTQVVDLASKINAAVVAEGGTAYTVQVTAIDDPVTDVVTTTAPGTTSRPAVMSFAKPRATKGLFFGLLVTMAAAQ
mmetsp:Transcript_117282/g.339060  ORF Transcript_117282/g.339060 Transcript_117282/m.339060 type:complete len:246 (-) Transcript_117282:147-884(-)